MWTREEAKRKIKALLAKAGSSVTPEEATAFAAKARELAQRYGIDPDSLDPEAVSESVYQTSCRGTVPYWMGWLMAAAAELNGCIAARGRRGKVIFYGREGDRLSAEISYEYLIEACNRAAREHLKDVPPYNRRRAGAAFRNGFALSVLSRAGAVGGPVSQEVALYAEGKVVSSSGARVRVGSAGSEAGSRVGLHRQAPGRSSAGALGGPRLALPAA